MQRLLIVGLLASCVSARLGAETDAPPRVLDPRIEIKLVMSDPDIVTPIGAAVDVCGRLFVIESHTHDAPRGYKGPNSDRIKILSDMDGDGLPETQRVFAEGLRQAMNLVFGPDGTLYVVTATELLALHDRDGDDACEERTSLLKLETANSNPHGRLLAVTLSHDGWIYTSRGNIGGQAYTFIGADGSKIAGRGEGGEIVRCKTDGSLLERVATGFWNPFDLRFDAQGRLICVDNDPDSRLHAAGGDPVSGERVFFSPTAGCVQCHRIRQRGGIIGPDLSVVARTANRDQLIHSIVKPSDDIAPQFQGWVVATKDGRSIVGLQGHMRGSAVTIITLDGNTMTIPGSNVASFQAMPASLMPEGLPFTMSPGDFRDLIAFLESLR